MINVTICSWPPFGRENTASLSPVSDDIHTVVPQFTNLIRIGATFVCRKVRKLKYRFPLKCMGMELFRSSISKGEKIGGKAWKFQFPSLSPCLFGF